MSNSIVAFDDKPVKSKVTIVRIHLSGMAKIGERDKSLAPDTNSRVKLPQKNKFTYLYPIPDKVYSIRSVDTGANLRDSVVRMFLYTQSIGIGLRWFTLTLEYLPKKYLKMLGKNVKIVREIILEELNKLTGYFQLTIGIQERYSYGKKVNCFDFNILTTDKVNPFTLLNKVSCRLEKRFKNKRIILKDEKAYFEDTWNTIIDINQLGHYLNNQIYQISPYKTIKFTRYGQSQELRKWNECIELVYLSNPSVELVRDSFINDGWNVKRTIKNDKQGCVPFMEPIDLLKKDYSKFLLPSF
jgi:hypothetical protein